VAYRQQSVDMRTVALIFMDENTDIIYSEIDILAKYAECRQLNKIILPLCMNVNTTSLWFNIVLVIYTTLLFCNKIHSPQNLQTLQAQLYCHYLIENWQAKIIVHTVEGSQVCFTFMS
jgi:RNA polymerase subunit RPABC4/transcription elongation factor Spt4